MCRGMGTFGYNDNEGDDKLISVKDLISLLVGTVANNGNLLIIGPEGRWYYSRGTGKAAFGPLENGLRLMEKEFTERDAAGESPS